MKPLIGIVTVLYNSESVLAEFFSSLDRQIYTRFRLYVIDNKSPDQSLSVSKELLKKYSFEYSIIENATNDGIARGNNLGIKAALEDGCEYVLLSNNDVVLEKDTIEVLYERLSFHQAMMAVPKIYLHGTTIFWAAGGAFNKLIGRNYHIGSGIVDSGQYQIEKKLSFAPTCFMLIHADVFSKIGFMDENYFVYWDDTDFIYRAQSEHLALWYIPDSIVHHKEGTSTGVMSDFSIRYLIRNFVYFSFKNYSLMYAFYVVSIHLLYHYLVILFKWPFHKWQVGNRAFLEGIKLYLSKKEN
jgi:GT2 family glycosyltransferase